MQTADTFEKPTSKSWHCIKNHMVVVLDLKQTFIRTDRLGICQLHLETVQPITDIGFHRSS